MKASLQIAIGFISNDRSNLPAPVLCSREAWQDQDRQDFPLRNKDLISQARPSLSWVKSDISHTCTLEVRLVVYSMYTSDIVVYVESPIR